MGDRVIKQLENQGLQMAKEKQTYVGKICVRYSLICLIVIYVIWVLTSGLATPPQGKPEPF